MANGTSRLSDDLMHAWVGGSGPLISRVQEGRVREHTRLDYEWFSAQVYGATSNVKVLDTFSSVFGPQFSERLFRGIKAATGHGARVQILLLDPDSLAVILRGRELGEQSADIRRDIMRNLRTLDRFALRLDEDCRHHCPRRRRRHREAARRTPPRAPIGRGLPGHQRLPRGPDRELAEACALARP
ncbi:hypothetical protein ACH4S8_44440 [Streptomyces sp. NPDC021080]|uniref:hypothetical protein n=1 Tax=Streptomyces sp. NPDC021080 TaxID=3365110 RepID=UPI0037BB4B32